MSNTEDKVIIGRAFSRGRGRTLESFQPLIIGRGRAASRAAALRNVDVVPFCDRPPMLEFKLANYITAGEGNIVAITLDYFANYDDYQYYMDKVIDAALKCPALITDFTMSIKLITLLKTHGEKIKRAMFSKLQATFEKKVILMREPDNVQGKETDILRNLCDLIGQLYYRFRVDLETQQRYNVFEPALIDCIKYLIHVKGLGELFILFKTVTQNYSALCVHHSEEMNEISLEIRSAIVARNPNTNKVYMSWMLCILECINHRSFDLPTDLKTFYKNNCGLQLTELAASRRLLVDIPDKVVNDEMDKFDCTLEKYTLSIFLSKESI